MFRRAIATKVKMVAAGALGAVAVFVFVFGALPVAARAAEAARPGSKQLAAASTTPSRVPVARKVSDFGVSEVGLINSAIQKGWGDHNLAPSKQATDGEFCRRVYLDLIGRVPKVEELNGYLADHKADKRERLVDSLLSEKYGEEFTRNWTAIWTNALIGRTGGNERKSLVNREGMAKYLTETIKYNKPYDEMARELITAVGSCRPTDSDFNGAANFLADKMAENGVQATAKTSQIFLGMAVQCTQCHNHPFNEYKQNQFWEMNAFFRQTRVEKLDDGKDGKKKQVARVVNADFKGEGGNATKAEIYYELRNGKLKVAYPVFVDGTSLATVYAAKGEDFGDHGNLSDINRREELAKLILASRDFDRAIVNRMWAHFLGYGFTKPIDDIGPHNPPSNPELLDALGKSFRSAGFDLKKLMRWIVLSEPYGLSSQISERNKDDDPSLGAKPMFSRFYLRQMEAEQLYESLLVATKADNTVGKEKADEMKERWLRQFSQAFGTDENDESTTFNGSIPQALTLMNGELMRRATGNQAGSMLYRVAADTKMDNAQKIRYLYLASLSRLPTKKELAISNELLLSRKGNVGSALQDIWWAVLNTNEFILIH
jgi:hypothetical protein